MMFTLADNTSIGSYLAKLIDEDGRFKSHREFCRAYLKLAGRYDDGDELTNMTNRLSQIIKGAKSIQIYDLPILTELLHVTCEEILSAGDSGRYDELGSDYLNLLSATEGRIRMDIISWAIDRGDVSELKSMRANEDPRTYVMSFNYPGGNTIPEMDRRYGKELLSKIANASEDVFNYYLKEYKRTQKLISHRRRTQRRYEYKFLFSYTPELIELLIEQNNPRLRTVLDRALVHNQKAWDELDLLIDAVLEKNFDPDWRRGLRFSKCGRYFSFHTCCEGNQGMVTNLIHISKTSKDPKINDAIRKINDIYEKVYKISLEGYNG